MSSINQFPWQDDILRALHAGQAASIDQIADVVAAADDGSTKSADMKDGIAQNVDHLVHLGLAEYTDGRGVVELTPAGKAAADSLP